jgi:hypothetical protein
MPDNNDLDPEQQVETAIASLLNGDISSAEAMSTIASIASLRIQRQLGDAASRTDSNDTPGAEGFFWNFWNLLLDAVQDGGAYDEQSRAHVDRAVAFIRMLKTHPPTPNEDASTWTIWRQSRTWRDLPLFGPAVRERYNGSRAMIPARGSSALMIVHRSDPGTAT